MCTDVRLVIAALVEAIMGFQFNHVGGGPITRRPIALELGYEESCNEPECEVADETSGNQFRKVTLEELHDHIENENLKLGDEFSEKDIIVRIRYAHSPNLTIIDTPGAHFTSTASDVCHSCSFTG